MSICLVTGGVGIVEDDLIVAADVSGKDDDSLLAIFSDRELKAGGAENVSGVVGLDVKVGRNVEATIARHGAKEFEDGIDVVAGIKRNGIGVLAPFLRMALAVSSSCRWPESFSSRW